MTAALAIVRALVALVLVTTTVGAQPFPVLSGDPVDPDTGRAYAILPGVPLLLPQPDGRFRPPIVDPTRIGDVDLVIRTGHLGIGPTMPPPAATPPVVIAGGAHVADGTEVPFTVIVSNGGAGLGMPLAGPEMNGIPVIIAAWADLDRDGFIGPTTDDAAGDGDLEREDQETLLVGRQVAVLSGGVTQGSIAVWRGAPASAGGLRVVLTALAYVGPFSPGFFEGNLPDGPGLATMLPFYPRLDPDRIVDGEGRGGPASPTGRIDIELEDEFDPPVDDPQLGTPFAIPTDGSSPTVDRAVLQSGPMARLRAVRASVPNQESDEELPTLLPGAGGMLYEPLDAVSVPADGPGNGTVVRLVPVDVLDNVTDPPAGATVTLVARAGVRIASPDGDGNPAREVVPVTSAAGVDVVLDDAGAGSIDTFLDVVAGGVPGERVAVRVGTGGPGPGGPNCPGDPGCPGEPTCPGDPECPGAGAVVRAVAIGGAPAALVGPCPAAKILVAVADDADSVSASLALDGVPVGTLSLTPGAAPPDTPLPAGPIFTSPFQLAGPTTGTLIATVTASDAAGAVGTPAALQIPVAPSAPATFGAVTIVPEAVEPRGARRVLVTARVTDDCGLRRVAVEADSGKGFKGRGRLRDDGRKADRVASDGVFSGRIRVRARAPGTTVSLRITAKNRVRGTSRSAATTLQVVP